MDAQILIETKMTAAQKAIVVVLSVFLVGLILYSSRLIFDLSAPGLPAAVPVTLPSSTPTSAALQGEAATPTPAPEILPTETAEPTQAPTPTQAPAVLPTALPAVLPNVVPLAALPEKITFDTPYKTAGFGGGQFAVLLPPGAYALVWRYAGDPNAGQIPAFEQTAHQEKLNAVEKNFADTLKIYQLEQAQADEKHDGAALEAVQAKVAALTDWRIDQVYIENARYDSVRRSYADQTAFALRLAPTINGQDQLAACAGPNAGWVLLHAPGEKQVITVEASGPWDLEIRLQPTP
jgi:hypothetical protein